MEQVREALTLATVLLLLKTVLHCEAVNHNYRLFGGKTWYGNVEIENGGEYRSLCVQNWDDTMANLLCKQMNFQSGVTDAMESSVQAGNPAWVIDNLVCTGSKQQTFDDCIQSEISEGKITESGGCTFGRKPVRIMCFNKVRLGRPYRYNSGKVQVLDKDGFYHDLCREGFNDVAASILCKELGFALGQPVCCPSYPATINKASNTNTTYCFGSESSISECLTSQACPTSTAVSSVVCSYGDPLPDISTVSFVQSKDGSILVEKGGYPGYICADGFQYREAMVFCRSRNYKHGFTRKLFPQDDRPFWVSRVNCDGHETSLHFCPYTIITNENCVEAAAVYCYDNIQTSLSLTGGSNNYSGLVQLQKHGMSGIYCKAGDDWRGEIPTVCRQISAAYVDGDVYEGSLKTYPEFEYEWEIGANCYEGLPLFDACVWDNSKVESMPQQAINSLDDYCHGSAHPLSVYCYRNVRLGCGYDSVSGVINMFVDGKWAQVCMHENFTDVEATVACKSLQRGFTRGRVLPGNLFARDFFQLTPPIQNLRCDIMQNSLFDCASGGGSGYSCADGEVAGVYCFKDSDPVKENLTVEYSTNGRVLVYTDGIKAGIDYRQWTNKEASVVCRERGFQNGIAVTLESRSPYRNGACYPTLVAQITCSGSESYLANCVSVLVQRDTYEAANYPSQILDAGVNCYNDVFTGDTLRLAGGAKPNYGRFEVNIDDKWGLMCNRRRTLTVADATNICRAVNPDFMFGEPYSSGILSDTTVTNTWSVTMNCDNQYSPGICFSGQWEQGDIGAKDNYCREGTEESVYCYSTVRLSARYGNSSGAVMVLSENIFDGFYICGDGFGDTEAIVTCRQLGFSQGKAIKSNNVIWHVAHDINYYNLNCTGNESSIANCMLNYGSGQCSSPNMLSSVQCFDDEINIPGNLDIRLNTPMDNINNDEMEQQSIVLVYLDGFWGYINGKTWNLQTARVVCTQMGYEEVQYYGNVYVNPHNTRTSKYPLVLETIDCTGTENHLESCNSASPVYSENVWDDRVATVTCDKQIKSTDTPNISTTESTNTSGADIVRLQYMILQLVLVTFIFLH